MPRHRIRRFLFEVLFLAAAAAVVTVGELRPAAVIAVMALAWLVVALFEWASWLDEPHYGRGLPPRYYVPQVALPPPRPVEQPRARRPRLPEGDDAPTRIASPGQWTAVHEDWPLLVPLPVGDDTEIVLPGDLPDGPVPEFPPEIEPAAPSGPGEDTAEAVALAEPDAEPGEEERAPAAEPVPEARGPIVPGDPASLPLPEPAAPAEPRVARHRIDPLGGEGRRRFRLRRAPADGAVAAVPDAPPSLRALPSRAPAGQRVEES